MDYMQEWFGTRTSADINLIAQIVMLVGLWIGFFMAHTHRTKAHANMQTSVVLAQLFFIFFVMVNSFNNFVIEGGTTGGTVARLMMIHGLLGAIAEGTGIYLLLRMRTKLIPERLRVRNFKRVMQGTLALWTIVAVLGFGIYFYRYLEPRSADVEAPLEQLFQAGDDLVAHALEMQEAIQRVNLNTAKRHAEHVVNPHRGQRRRQLRGPGQ